MEMFETKNIRNVCLLGHGDAGKTSLAEAMLYIGKATDRLGKISEGNTVCDYDAEEVKRSCSINSTVAPLVWQGIKINVLDTPGYPDFEGDLRRFQTLAGILHEGCRTHQPFCRH